MGFWNALSALAPIAPAMSDAKDLRTAREQDAAKFASDQELTQAQLTAHKLAAQAEQQRITQNAQPVIIGEPQWNPTTHSNQVLTFDKNTGGLALKDVPGTDPSTVAAAKYAAAKKDYKTTTGHDLSPEEDESLFFQSYGYKPTASKVTQLTGDAGKPYKGNDGQYYVKAKDASGAVIDLPMGPNYNPPAPKQSTSPAAQYANLLTKQILANRKQGPPLTNEESAQLPALQQALNGPGIARMKAMAEFNAQNRLQMVTGDDGQDIAIPVAAGIAAFNQGNPYGGPGIGSATGMDKKNQQLAASAIQQVDRMKAILKTDPGLTGPGSGQLTRLQMLLGSQDPEAQQFLISSLLASEHGVAVFGGRNIHTINDLNDALGSMKTNPAALSAALDVVKETMTPWLLANNRLKNPRASASGNTTGTTYKQTATGPGNHKIGSNDGGVTWYDVKTGKKI